LIHVLAVVQLDSSTPVLSRAGYTVVSKARARAVTLIQRFGAVLNRNLHLHMLFLDGLYWFRGIEANSYSGCRPTNAEL